MPVYRFTEYMLMWKQAPLFVPGHEEEVVLQISRVASLTLLCLYLLYLLFSLRTHENLFRPEAPDSYYSDYYSDIMSDDEDEDEESSVDQRTAIVVLFSSIALLAFCIFHLMRDVDAVIQTRSVTTNSLGFIFIPFACSGAKNAIAVDLAIKNEMEKVSIHIVNCIECFFNLTFLYHPSH